MRATMAPALIAALLFSSHAPAAEHSFDSGGVKIHYLDEGKGEPVVLLHGFAASAEELWVKMPFAETQVLPELAKEFRVIAPDLRGHGKSGKPHDPKMYGKEMAEDVIRLLDHLKIEKAHVVGYSLGAMVAGKLLAAHPDRLLSATLGGGAPYFRRSEALDAAVLATAESLEQGKGIGPLVIFLTAEGQPKPSPEQAALVSKVFLAGKDQKALAAVLRGGQGLAVTPEQLKSSKVPVCFVYGSREGELKKTIAAARELFPGATVRVIEGGDHISTLARPEFLEAVREFLRARKK